MKKKKKDSIWGHLAVIGIGVVTNGIILANMPAITDAIADKTNPYVKLGEGLPLSSKGAHLRQGAHNVVLTESFYEALDKDNQFRCDLAVRGIKEAYEDMNKYNKGLSFNLCTTNSELSNKYYIPMAEKLANDDIYIYGTNDILLNSNAILGIAEHNKNILSCELNDLKITFRLNKLYQIWNDYMYSTEKTLNTPHNSALYSCAVHETMHIMGLRHIEESERISILNPYLEYCNRELTKEDIELLDRYNVQFYNTKSIFEEDNKDVVVTSATKEDEEEMSM